MARTLIVVRDSSGTTPSDVPVQIATSTASVLIPCGTSGMRMVPPRDRVNTEFTAAACGLTSSTTLRTSDYSALPGGLVVAVP